MIGRNYSKFLHGFFCAFVCLFLINLLCTLHFAFPKRLVTFSLMQFSPIQSSVQHKQCDVPVSCQGLQERFIDTTGEFHALDAQLEVGIYSVFLDKRKSDNITEKRSASGHRNGVLRIFLAKRRIPSPKLYCHFIGTNGEVRTVASRNLLGRLAIDIELIPLIWSDDPDIISRRSWYYFQIITVNDCLYRSMRDVDFVFFGDIDEILVPVSPTAADWGTLTDYFWGTSSHNLTRPGYCFDSAIFPTQDTEDFERPFHRDYTRRVEKLDILRRKCLVRPLWIFEMGIHHISKPYEESTAVALNVGAEHSEMAIVHHYRKGDIDSKERTIEDKSLEIFLP
ncbi:unnamed protein product [Dibothriocephalus latus]|uniref:Glycosyltransferase family 92 protein n=1 Tax=Dibothriocephalus latus TaxID=60516 RepID=A0A3P7NLP2_DIBLA|nr:unnamed protein product [Dibothriocephalus latus]